MYPLSDKDLDRLSREASDQYDVDQNTSGWDNLERSLNKELPVQKEKERKRFLWFLLLLVMITGGGLFIMLQQNPEPGIATNKSNPAEQTAAVNKDQNKIAANEQKTKAQSQDLLKSNSEKDNLKIGEKNPTTPGEETVVVDDKARVSRKSVNQPGQEKFIPLTKRNKASGQKQSDPIVRDKDESINKQKESNKEELVKSNPDPDKQAGKATVPLVDKKEEAAITGKTEDKPAEIAKTEKKAAAKNNSKQNNSRFSIGLLTGIDKSSVHNVSDNNFGYSVGLTGQYNISKRWSVSTGLIYTKKEYTAAGDDYHPPKHYWTYYVDLKKVSGDCQMLEIPLNVRYNINQNTKSQWFASAGLSTYFMMNQNYRYYYYFTGMPSERDWNRSDDTTHLLSIVNLSAGFEKSISRTLSIQAEPYLKIPLSGMGFGQMDINSYGLYLTLKYSPIKKTTATKTK